MLTATVVPTDPELQRYNSATATIAATFEIEAFAEDLRNAVRAGDRQLARAAHTRLVESITKAGQFIDIAFPVREIPR